MGVLEAADADLFVSLQQMATPGDADRLGFQVPGVSLSTEWTPFGLETAQLLSCATSLRLGSCGTSDTPRNDANRPSALLGEAHRHPRTRCADGSMSATGRRDLSVPVAAGTAAPRGSDGAHASSSTHVMAA